MRLHISAILRTVIVLFCTVSSAHAQSLSGENDGRPPAFSVEGPWTIDWRATSEFPVLASIEMRLYDSQTDDFLGTIVEIKGTGSGLKVFENTGSFQIVVVGTFVKWNLEIEEISDEQAGRLLRHREMTPSLVDSAKQASRLVPESSFSSWRPENNENLLLFNDDGIGWRVQFSPGCPGLSSATAISFVMTANTDEDLGSYDSILLDDGRRCYFEKVIPYVALR